MPGDVAVGNLTNQLIGDCNFGLYWSGDRHFVGFSAYNLFENKTDLLALTTLLLNTSKECFIFMEDTTLRLERYSNYNLR